MKMNASTLKHLYQTHNPDGHYFERSTMRFFGDTMSNYAVSSQTVKVRTHSGEIVECYVLRRKHPVKHGLKDPTFFSSVTFDKVHGELVTE